ncbi:rhamnan synthesis F family protein [Jannaschia sp. CCS1]|uniref:rhamnan synthesis F family protein n=1 Tax=Jannaschia sp. (strain CCS1) TaxID=290400 RepID=UPI000053B04F|nr:rhamnan synthesis F family protein [Jannaschia sp. CCS1]ABD57193.1 Lipopolysaccharide biosynthesis protein-like protein [Jannaschia sp. CCS1]
MIPAWKIKRELKRFVMQMGYLPWMLAAPRAKRAYDARKAAQIRLTQGVAPRTSELAVLLLFQPRGITASTLHTLEHLKAHGVSTLVVSNAPLSDTDRASLATHAWLIMERPNYGYDFGGYRDAILHILEDDRPPARLFVLNDSIWFPLQPDSDLIEDARASDTDLYGFVLNDRMRGAHRAHLQSYFFSFGPRAVASPAFAAYWRDLFLTNNKNLVVRRCEIPMTGAFRTLGFSVAARHRYSDGAQALKALDNATLARVIAYQVQVDTRNAPRLKPHLTEGPRDAAWRARVDADIDAGLLDKYFLIAHPAVLIGQLRVPLLKKDHQSIYQLQRRELFAGGYDTGFAPRVRDEIRSWDSPD